MVKRHGGVNPLRAWRSPNILLKFLEKNDSAGRLALPLVAAVPNLQVLISKLLPKKNLNRRTKTRG